MSKKRFKPVFLLLFGLFLSLQSAAQVTLKSTVRDQNTGAPLPFCTVAVVGKNQGCLSNEEGRFEITVATRNDSLRFQYLGYQPLTRCARDLLQAPDVRLEPAEYQLGEVEIFAGADYLYDLVGRCRKRLQAARPTPARVYFSLDTEISQRPVEMLECYYNGVVNGSQITTLDLKAGRIGLAPQAGGRIFVSLNSSEALRLVNLTTGSERLPPIPLQYRGRQLPKNFVLSRKNSRDTTLQRIDFEPVRGKNGFSGEMWIEKSSANLRRITLSIDSAAVYPFAPYRPHDSLLQVGLEITQEFAATPAGPRLQYIDFKYSIRLLNWLDSGGFDPQPRRIFTTGRMVCYDYGQPFLLPLFEPEQNRYPTSTDYGKIADRPYNPGFWAHNTSLAYTERQERILHFLQTEGKLLNFQQRLGWHDNEPFLEHNNVCWSDTQRVWLRKPATGAENATDFRLAAQVFLDIDEDADSLRHFSVTVLDTHRSYFASDNPDAAACFLNIFFDLCEIRRRDMERQLATRPHTVAELKAAHVQATRDLERLANQYVRETNLGQNRTALRRWNQVVLGQLGIDNFRLFRQ